MRHIHRNVYQDSNGDLVMIEPKSMFSNEKKITNLSKIARGDS